VRTHPRRSSPEYKGRQPVEANSYEPTAELDLGAWYWRIDEVNGANTWAGPVWSFTITSVAGADGNGVVYYEAGKFAGWPANNGLLWHWGDDEVVVGFERGEFCCISGHNICGEHYSLLARSTDAGRTWNLTRRIIMVTCGRLIRRRAISTLLTRILR